MTNPNDPVQPTRPVQPVVVAATTKRGPLDYILAVAFVVAVGGVAFAVGRTTAPAQTSTPNLGGFAPNGGFVPTGSFDPGAGGPGGGLGGFGGGLTIEGTVTSIDGSTLVIQTASGQEVTVDLEADTTYHEATSADAGAIAAGDEVTVRAAGAGQFGPGGLNPGASSAPSITATDVTVER